MTTFKQYLAEQENAHPMDGAERDKASALAWIRQHAPGFFGARDFIWRGGFYKHPINYIDSNTFNRRSANSPTVINTVVDGAPAWKDYPERRKGLICSTDMSTAAQFSPTDIGSDEPWVVIPADNAKIGICPEGDFWWSFKILGEYTDVGDLSNLINVAIKGILRQPTGLTWPELSDQMSKITFAQLQDEETGIDVFPGLFKHFHLDTPDSTLLDMVTKLIVPGAPNNFHHSTGAEIWTKLASIRDNELWIQGECLIVHQATAEQLIKEGK